MTTITPKFEIDQDENNIYLKIFLPNVKLNTLEYVINENVFRFICSPYFLRLTFNQKLSSKGKDIYKYDFSSSNLNIVLPKENQGEFFENLLSTTEELKKNNEKKKPIIEVMEDINENELEEIRKDKNFSFDLKQNLFEEEIKNDNLLSKPTYGFDSKYNGYFTGYHGTLVTDIIDLKEPEKIKNIERKNLMLNDQKFKFSPEKYM
jgi:protein SHQ1